MLILLPPSEGKRRPETGEPLDLASLSSPELTTIRENVLDELADISASADASTVLKVGPSLTAEVEHNVQLRSAAAARADEVYTGVLFAELGPESMTTTERARLTERVLIASALFGLVRPDDRIPAYRLSGAVTLPALGTLRSVWKPALGEVIKRRAGDELVVELRSGTYVSLGPVPKDLNSVTVRVLLEKDGKRSVVSHFNKASKGRLVRELVKADSSAADPKELATALNDLGFRAELSNDRIDVIVTEV